MAVVLESAKGEAEPVRQLEPARWSLTPGWSKTLPTFNARSEGMAEKATWRGPLKTHRCIVPIDGFYERVTDPVTKKKTPFYMSLPDGKELELAGLYSWWRDHLRADDDPDAWTLTATILTSDAVHTLENIHDRNPVPLPRAWRDIWLDPTIEGDQALVDTAVADAVTVANTLEIREVAPLKGDGPKLVEPVSQTLSSPMVNDAVLADVLGCAAPAAGEVDLFTDNCDSRRALVPLVPGVARRDNEIARDPEAYLRLLKLTGQSE
jgi:putative SOS response-associated peptidase YedK